eukprot:TCONS_00033057-protein
MVGFLPSHDSLAAMSYGYPSPTPHDPNYQPSGTADNNTGSTQPTSGAPVKLYHPTPSTYRMEASSSRATLHHQGSEWPPPSSRGQPSSHHQVAEWLPSTSRGPPPTYSAQHGVVIQTYQGGTPPPPVLVSHHVGGESDALGNCLCASCVSFNNNRPPDYPPTLPPAPTLPHHSSATHHPQSSSSWHQQHSNISHSGGVHHSDYYSSPSSSHSSNFPPPQISSTMTAHERNNNEPSMVSPSSRYTPVAMMHGSAGDNLSQRQEMMPSDPREWTAHDVMKWIQWASVTLKVRDLHMERFQMNGKALCLMDLSMFLYRVPDGGERLYQDFQARLQKALCQDKR